MSRAALAHCAGAPHNWSMLAERLAVRGSLAAGPARVGGGARLESAIRGPRPVDNVAAPSSAACLPHLHPAQRLYPVPQIVPETLHPEFNDEPWESQIERVSLSFGQIVPPLESREKHTPREIRDARAAAVTAAVAAAVAAARAALVGIEPVKGLAGFEKVEKTKQNRKPFRKLLPRSSQSASIFCSPQIVFQKCNPIGGRGDLNVGITRMRGSSTSSRCQMNQVLRLMLRPPFAIAFEPQGALRRTDSMAWNPR